MKLSYNGFALDQLGVLQMSGQACAPEPAEAPQWQRVTLRWQLHLTEQSYRDNQGLVDEFKSALGTQQAELLWVDDTGTEFAGRTVAAGDWEQGNPAGGVWGTYYMVLTFQFSYLDNDVAANCLSASAANLDLGAVVKWDEGYDTTLFDPMRDARKRVEGAVTASGRWLGDTTQGLSARTAALLAQKDALLAALVTGANVPLKYGTFNAGVRVKNFRALVNQPLNYVEWSISATFTRYPNEADYSVCEFRFGTRVNAIEGIVHLTLAGKIAAPTAAAARAKLASIQAAYIPDTFVQLTNDTEENQVQSNSTGGRGDGNAFIELTFNCEYRDVTTLEITYTPSGVGGAPQDLGEVEKWSERHVSDLFNELRSTRRRVAGIVTASGRWWQPDSVALADKQANLEAVRIAMLAALQGKPDGTLSYAEFSQVVRMVDFDAQVDRLQNSVGWTLTAHWTRFPNESDYSLCEYRMGTNQAKTEGMVVKTLAGKIGAPTEAAARTKLAVLQTAVIPAGFVCTLDRTDANTVEMDSGAGNTGGAGKGDGAAFIELSFQQEFTQTVGNILRWDLRIATTPELKTGFVKTTYAGSVQATGATLAAAYATAAAQATALGDGKFPMQLSSTVTQTQRQFLTSGNVFVVVEFSYEYQTKNTVTYVEVLSELSVETFGQDTETVSGYIAAPTLSAALAAYTTNVRNLAAYTGALILRERVPTLAQQRINGGVALDEVFRFSFSVFRPKANGTMQFTLEPQTDFVNLDVTTTVRGTVFAGDEVTAEAMIANLVSGLGLGVLVRTQRAQRFAMGPAVGGSPQSPGQFFEALEFQNVYVARLGGVTGILESGIEMAVDYAGTRWVEKAIPDGVSVMQNCGTRSGRRTVNVNAKGPTESAVQAYVRGVRAALITGPYEEPPKITIKYEFLPLTAGVAGDAGNVKLFVANAVFAEVLPAFGFTP